MNELPGNFGPTGPAEETNQDKTLPPQQPKREWPITPGLGGWIFDHHVAGPRILGTPGLADAFADVVNQLAAGEHPIQQPVGPEIPPTTPPPSGPTGE